LTLGQSYTQASKAASFQMSRGSRPKRRGVKLEKNKYNFKVMG